MNYNNYQNQKLRGLKRKYEAVIARGGKCEKCGYSHNISALDFHHINPEEKEFEIDIRKFSNASLSLLNKELDKCILLCANCHREVHNPTLNMKDIQKIIETAKDKKSFSNETSYGSICPVCGKRFPKVTGKTYCSIECRDSVRYKNYPSKEQVLESYQQLKSWEKVAEYYNITRKIIQRIRRYK